MRREACAWLLRDLKNAVLDARLRGLHEDDVPEVVVDCTAHFTPASRVLPPDG